jgi:hypothetical protein
MANRIFISNNFLIERAAWSAASWNSTADNIGIPELSINSFAIAALPNEQ